MLRSSAARFIATVAIGSPILPEAVYSRIFYQTGRSVNGDFS